MSNVEIENKEQFLEITKAIENCFVKIYGNKYVEHYLQLKKYFVKVWDEKIINEDEYIEIVSGNIKQLIILENDNEVYECILNFSRIHSAVGELLIKYNLYNKLAEYIALHEVKCTDANRTLIIDLLYHYYVMGADQKYFREGGIESVIKYVKEIPELQLNQKEYVVHSILAYYIDMYHSNDVTILKQIINEFGENKGLVKKVDKLLAKINKM